MSGLDKIIERITKESESQAGAILDEAKAKAGRITAESRKKVSEERAAIEKRAESQAETILERGHASADLKAKQILLSGRQEVLRDTVDLARKRLETLPDDEYREFFIKLFKKHLPKENAVLRIGGKDMERLSEAGLEELKKTAAEAGSKIEIPAEAADIKSGFILDFGGVEENCTLDALFEQSIEDMSDRVRDILF